MNPQRVKTGQRITAGDYNMLVSALRPVPGGKIGTRPGGRVPGNLQSGVVMWGVNKTGADLRLGDVAAINLDDPIACPDEPTRIISTGTVVRLREPEDGDAGNFVVCADLIPDNESGWVYLSGVVLARLTPASGSEEESDFADVESGSCVLVMSAAGSARIEWKSTVAGDDGNVWALIRFPIGSGTPQLYKAVADASGGQISVKAIDSNGDVVGDEIVLEVLP